MPSFQIFEFTRKNLLTLLSNSHTSIENIELKNHFEYLNSYLGKNGLNAKSIIVEENYISKDFFSDYSAYYSFCYQNYSKYCKRLHFFSKEFSEFDFHTAMLRNENENNWVNECYLGYIVVKPIPYTVIGTTILKTYKSKEIDDYRKFFGIRSYSVNLFGFSLKIDSLAFQEQDSVLSACATTAIWSTLQKAAVIDYHVNIKTPFEITQDAAKLSIDGGRLFPNNGLTIYQMCQALTNAGLVVEVRNEPKDLTNLYLKKIIHAYAPISIPIILGVEVPTGHGYGLHAIAVSGYRLPEFKPTSPVKHISWIPNYIDKIYVHDDQYGPFARIEFNGDDSLKSDWSNKESTKVVAILIPVFHKIRISYDDVESIIVVVDNMLSYAFNDIVKHEFYWEIQVLFSNDYKHALKLSELPVKFKEEIIYENFPKYIWVATCKVGNIKVFDFVFDATDIANSCFLFRITAYDKDLKNSLKEFLVKNNAFARFIKHPNSFMFYDKIITSLLS